MQQKYIVCIALMLCALKGFAQKSYDARVREYITQYKDWAIAEQKRSGIPAAITLAQGIHETSAGSSELATNANNHFGIKCKKEWQGETYAYTDDAPDECFRKYPSALQSYKDHSDYLAGSKRYASLFKLSVNDYKGWAHGLKRCGYATNPKYASLLIKIVEEYDLHQYTLAAINDYQNPVKEAEQKANNSASREIVPDQDMPAPKISPVVAAAPQASRKKKGLQVSYDSAEQIVKKEPEQEVPTVEADPSNPEYGKLVKINGLRAFYAKKGTVLLEDAFRYNIRYARLLELNDLPDFPLEADMYIYLDKKNPKGIHETRVVKEGETLIQIAQAEAMQLKYLKYYNRISVNEEPAPGAVLQLQQYSENKPPTYVKTVAPRETVPAFAGSNPDAVPQGATRTSSRYITKKEIDDIPVSDDAVKTHQEEHTVAAPQVEAPVSEAATVEPVQSTSDAVVQTVENNEAATLASQTETATIIEEAEKVVTGEAVAAVVAEPVEVPREEVGNESAPAETLTSKKEELDYEIIQPDPVVVGSTASQPDVAKSEEEMKLSEPEIITPLQPTQPVVILESETPVVAVPEKKEVPQIQEEPKDEFDRLKARLDKVVYAGSINTPSSTPSVVEEPKKDTVKKIASTSKEASSESKMYTVKKGDTAFSIARKHNITMRQLMDWNKLDFDKVKEGQKLRVKP